MNNEILGYDLLKFFSMEMEVYYNRPIVFNTFCSREGFFTKGVTMASLNGEGTWFKPRRVLMILTKVGNRGSIHSLMISVERGSTWHYFVGASRQ